MKKLALIAALFCFGVCAGASAADITLYYSPSCPHCHHARAFISDTLVYEYPDMNVTAVNVMDEQNLSSFRAALEKCGYKSGGVPVMVIGDKCFQGYANFMQNDLRAAVEADLTDVQKQTAADNKKALADDPEKFKSEHSSRSNAVSEHGVESAVADASHNTSGAWFYGLLIALVAVLGFVLIRKDKHNK